MNKNDSLLYHQVCKSSLPNLNASLSHREQIALISKPDLSIATGQSQLNHLASKVRNRTNYPNQLRDRSTTPHNHNTTSFQFNSQFLHNGPPTIGTASPVSATNQMTSNKHKTLPNASCNHKSPEIESLLVQNYSKLSGIERDPDVESSSSLKKSLSSYSNSRNKASCRWTFIFDPAGRFMYWWNAVISCAFMYNFWIIIYRHSFEEIRSDNLSLWFSLDYSADFLYILDIAISFRTGHLEDGVLQTETRRMRIHYLNSTKFYIDCLCLLPLDFLYLSIGFKSLVRVFRLVKVYKFWQFSDRTERHTNYPNIMRSLKLLHYLLAIIHWNACIFQLVSASIIDNETNSITSRDTLGTLSPSYRDTDVTLSQGKSWKIPQYNTSSEQYLYAIYWSMLTLTLMGDLPKPVNVSAIIFVIFEVMFGLLLFATVIGHVGNIVTNVSAARKDFQARLDNVKGYLTLRRVPAVLQDKVIKWFDYLWSTNKISDEEKVLSTLPDKLKAEIAIHVHLDTLKRVEIFQDTEEGFLSELVLRLRPVLFSPGDFICRKGEVGKDMYVVNRGRLHVVAEDGKQVLATLKPGSYFGEISILNIGKGGNRRTASVKSVGYSDLFCLSKTDLWDVLKEYPVARANLEAVAKQRLAAYKKQAPNELEEKKAAGSTAQMSRSNSTPGLVESQGKDKNRKSLSKVSRLRISDQETDSLSRQQLYRSCCEMPTDQKQTKNREYVDGEQVLTTRKMTLAIPSPGIQDSSSMPCSSSCIASPNSRRSSFDQGSYRKMVATNSEHLYIQNIPVINIELASSPDAQVSSHPPTNQTTPFKSSPSNYSCLTTSPSPALPNSPTYTNVWEPSSEILVQELSRLRQRVLCLETENTGLLMRLNQQQSILETRLGELEMRDKVNHQYQRQSQPVRHLSASRSHLSSSDSFDPYYPADSDKDDQRCLTEDKSSGAV